MLNLKSIERAVNMFGHLWRFVEERDHFGGVLFDEIRSFLGLVDDRVGKEVHDHSIWKSIRASWERIFGFVKFVVGVVGGFKVGMTCGGTWC